MDQEDQRDHAEEAANRAATEREAREELDQEAREVRFLAMWRHGNVHAQVALINMCDVYVRSHASPLGFAATLGEDLMVIMVSALHGVGAEEASVIVAAEIREAHRRMGNGS